MCILHTNYLIELLFSTGNLKFRLNKVIHANFEEFISKICMHASSIGIERVKPNKQNYTVDTLFVKTF